MTITDDSYNGWTNRETWAVALHIDNSQTLHTKRIELCEAAQAAHGTPFYEGARLTHDRAIVLARSLQEWIEGLHEAFFDRPEDLYGVRHMFQDVGSLWRVDWREIADHFLLDYPAIAGQGDEPESAPPIEAQAVQHIRWQQWGAWGVDPQRLTFMRRRRAHPTTPGHYDDRLWLYPRGGGDGCVYIGYDASKAAPFLVGNSMAERGYRYGNWRTARKAAARHLAELRG